MRAFYVSALALVLALCAIQSAFSAEVDQKVLWQRGTDGYHTYRIPALAVTTRGTLLAFCEGRKNGGGDSGDIDLLFKRSTDQGETWSAQQVVWDGGDCTSGNPAPVVDRQTGTIWLLMTWNRADDTEKEMHAGTARDTRRVFVTSSADDGQTWAPAREITDDVKDPSWKWYATGPGAGIQLERGPHAGRLVIPCDHNDAQGRRFSHVIYSDDHGKSWKLGGRAQEGTNECEVVELSDGRLLLNMRNYAPTIKARQVAFSADGGASWTGQRFDETLIEPVCQAGIRRFAWPSKSREGVILFSNPASAKERVNLTVRASRDDGRTWPLRLVLNPGPSAYSDLAVFGQGRIGCLYERGAKKPYDQIVLARFGMDQLERAN